MRRHCNGDWYLVKFLEDDIWYSCPSARIKINSQECYVRWPSDGKWYKAKIYASGDKETIKATKIQYEQGLLNAEGSQNQSSDNQERHVQKVQVTEDKKISDSRKIVESPNRKWRKFCNVPLDVAENTDGGCGKINDEAAKTVLYHESPINSTDLLDVTNTQIPYNEIIRISEDKLSMKNDATVLPESSNDTNLTNLSNLLNYDISDTAENPLESSSSVRTEKEKLFIDISNSHVVSFTDSDESEICLHNNRLLVHNRVFTDDSLKDKSHSSVEMYPSKNHNASAANLNELNHVLSPKSCKKRNASPTKCLSSYADGEGEKPFEEESEEYIPGSSDNSVESELEYTEEPDQDKAPLVANNSKIKLVVKNDATLPPESANGTVLTDLTNVSNYDIFGNVESTLKNFTPEKEKLITDISNNHVFSFTDSDESEICLHDNRFLFHNTVFRGDESEDKSHLSVEMYPSENHNTSAASLNDLNDVLAPRFSERRKAAPSTFLSSDIEGEVEEPFEEESEEYIPGSSDNSVESGLEDTEHHDKDKDLLVANKSENSNVTFIPSIPIATISKSQDVKRKWDKKFFCMFCKKLFAKLPRHLYRAHSEESEVVKILSLNKNSTERKKILLQVQNHGTFLWNSNAIKTGEGSIMLKRRVRPEKEKSIKDFLPCEYCCQMISANYLYRHQKICVFKPNVNEESNAKRNRGLRSSNFLILPIGPEVSERFKSCILSKMSGDDIYRTVRSDQLILLFGESVFSRKGHDIRYHRQIIDRCRELGRLLLAIKSDNPTITKLTQLLDATKYKIFKNGVYKVSGFDRDTNTFSIPSLALKLGYSMKKCALTLKGDYLEDEILRFKVTEIENFLEVMRSKWERDVSYHARRNIAEKKWNSPKLLPITKDIQVLHKYLMNNAAYFRESLEKKPNEQTFESLSEITLVMVLILNRKRVGEAQFIELEDYKKAQICQKTNSDIFNSLTETEKELSKTLIRLVIKGKRDRGVPVLLTKNLQDNITVINKYRDLLGVQKGNIYLFPSLRNSCGYFRADKLLKKYAKAAGCQAVDTITSTHLRKHVATTVQILNLRENEMDSLAQFMGHDIQIHRQYYRLADETMQLAKISKVLLNMEKGNVAEMKGKNLDEIEVDAFIGEKDISSDDENLSKYNTEEENTTSTFAKSIKRTKQQDIRKLSNQKEIRDISVKRKFFRTPWSKEEKVTTLNHFRRYLDSKTLPGKNEIEKFMLMNCSQLKNRTWRNIKDLLYNQLKKQIKDST